MKKLCLLFACVLSVFCMSADPEIEWAKKLFKEYPELSWLANKKGWKTEEATATKDSGSWTEKLYGEKLMELDRTLLGLRCMNRFVSGTKDDYNELASEQKEDKKLS